MSHVFLHIPVFSHGRHSCYHSQLDLPFSITIIITLIDLPMSIIINYNHSHVLCIILLSTLCTLIDLPTGITITLTYLPISITTVTITWHIYRERERSPYQHYYRAHSVHQCSLKFIWKFTSRKRDTTKNSLFINKLFLVISLFLLVNFQHLLKEDYSVA